ncbi:cobalt-precorrin-6A reductase [Rhizobium sp. NRK18]|uniref:cobalt-precorrin-6A reductase n=1 Tax=Rhizobium sp. NRK18 TaxID=2964667 RepID=UPI0021C285AE|nr:cobalt-precorrin-6A reductase [Rhizobium sp. NRK18]MCQ2003902.1 cobalt-precorrin-6A reductase [Rhizobium sp. NRK18]
MPDRILILGGTREAAALAETLSKTADVTTSLAGRTREPAPLSGAVRSGGFGGIEGLARYLSENAITKVIDATHPFARTISANAVEACRRANVPLEVLTRPQWKELPGDDWTEVASIEAAVKALPAAARVLLALGRQHIEPFAARTDCHFVIRMVDPPEMPLSFTRHDLVLAKPSSDPDDEKRLMQHHRISHLVARNSGGDGAYAKIIAARDLGLPVIMISRIKA